MESGAPIDEQIARLEDEIARAEQWLDDSFDKLGRETTVDMAADYL